MEHGFNLDGFLDALAERVAAKLAQHVSPTRVQSRLMTVEQAAGYLGRTKEAVQHMIASGKLRTVRIDRRVCLDVRDLDRLIDESKT